MRGLPKNLVKPQTILLITLFLLHVFFMFVNPEKWGSFGWDQVDNAWAAMRIIAAHKYPLLGMVAKGNSGIYIGPLYYYFVSIFYFFTRMDPIASPIIAAVTSLFSFGVLYVITKRLFSVRIALVALAIYTFSSFTIAAERVQWPVNFIAPLALLIFYFLYKVITGETKYFIYLAATVGLSFHIHFTAVFYPIIILTALPWVRWNKTALKHITWAILTGSVFFIPQIIYSLQASHAGTLTPYSNYLLTNYHGFHLRRVLQLLPDAFIKFQSLLMTPYAFVRYVTYLFIPVFYLTYLMSKRSIEQMKLSYLIALWFIVPWFVFATYSGEISDYYFNVQSYVVIMVLAYITSWVWDLKNIAGKILITAFWFYWTVSNVIAFTATQPGSLPKDRAAALDASMTARIINFTEGDPQSYLYYYYMYREHKWLPYKL